MKIVLRFLLAIIGLFVIAAGIREGKASPIPYFLAGTAIIGIGLVAKIQTKDRTRSEPN